MVIIINCYIIDIIFRVVIVLKVYIFLLEILYFVYIMLFNLYSNFEWLMLLILFCNC